MRHDEPFFPGVLVVAEGTESSAHGRAHHVLTLPRLRARLRAHFAPELELAEPSAVRIALAHVAPGVVASDPWLGAIARRGGRAWLRIVDALYIAMGAIADRRESLVIVGRGHDAVATRARLLARLTQNVGRLLLEASLIDPRSEGERVADLVAHAEPRDVSLALAGTQVRASGIVDWTPADLALFRVLDASLSRIGGRATIELPVFEERPLDAERERDALEALTEAVASALDDAPETSPIRCALGDISVTGTRSAAGDARVDVRSAIGAEAQGRAVAAVVHAALMEGVSPSDVEVALMSEDEASARAILRALGAADIATVDARRVRPRRSNLVAACEYALEVAERGIRRTDVARLLRSQYVDTRGLLGDGDDGGRRVVRDLARALEETPTAEGESPTARLSATVTTSAIGRKRGPSLGQAALLVGQSFARAAEATTRAEQARAARALWRDLGLGRATPPSPSLASASRTSADLADLEARAVDEEAWKALEETRLSLERSAARLGIGDAEISLATFRHELRWAYLRCAPPSPLSPAAVRLVRLADASGAARVVVVADADGESWVERRDRSELLPFDLEERLDAATDPTLRPIMQAGSFTSFARLALATRAAEQVTFTYRARDEDGRARSPAPIVAQLAPREAAQVSPGAPLSDREWTLAELLQRPEAGATLAPDAARRARLERLREESFGAEIGAEHPLAVTLPRGDPFTRILTEETGGGTRAMAASAVDGLASCVFKGYVAEVLRPRRLHEASDLADARETGQLTHAALEEAFRATTSLWGARPRDAGEIVRVGMEAADRVLARDAASSELARVATDHVRARVRAILDWSIADLAWDFACAEQAFGEEGGWDQVVLGEGAARVALRGRIDRVDVAHDSGAVRVLDYKARERAADAHTAALGTTKFQIALYGRAAAAGLQRARSEGLYLATQRSQSVAAPKKHLERWEAAHELVDGVPRVDRRILDLVLAVRSGDLSVRPYTAAACAQCDFDGVCRKPRFAPAGPHDETEESSEPGR